MMQFILLAALVLPAMVPTGYMVKRNAETNLVELTVCSGVKHRQILLDIDTGAFHEIDSASVLTSAPTIAIVETELCPLAISAMAMGPDLDHDSAGPAPIALGPAPAVDPVVETNHVMPPARAPPLHS
jgi:hypothetical protein